MSPRFTQRAQHALAHANMEAQRLNHAFVGSEHILLGVIKEGCSVAAKGLRENGVDLKNTRIEVEKLVQVGVTKTEHNLPPTPRAAKVIEYAIEEALGMGQDDVAPDHLLLGVLREADGVAAQVLRNLGLKLDRLRDKLVLDLHSLPIRVNVCPICKTLDQIGSNPSLLCELDMSYAMLGENQGCPGWCVLLLKDHHEHVANLPLDKQLSLFDEVSRIAAAIRAVFPTSGKDGLPPRINYECLGNLVPHIHWHIIPRHADDPDPTKAVWHWPEQQLKGAMTPTQRADLITKLRAAL